MGDTVAQVAEIAQLAGNRAALDPLGMEDRPEMLPQVHPVAPEQRTPEPERQLGHHAPVGDRLPVTRQLGVGLGHAVLLVAAGEGDRIGQPVRPVDGGQPPVDRIA